MDDKNTFEYADKISAKELADYFMKLADGFRCKSLELQSGGKTIALTPEDKVKVEVKAKCKEDEGEFELEVSWKREYTAADEKLEVTPCSVDESTAQ